MKKTSPLIIGLFIFLLTVAAINPDILTNPIDTDRYPKENTQNKHTRPDQLQLESPAHDNKTKIHNSTKIIHTITETRAVINGNQDEEAKINSIQRLGDQIRTNIDKDGIKIIRAELISIISGAYSEKIRRTAFFSYSRSINSDDTPEDATNLFKLSQQNQTISASEIAAEFIHIGMLLNDFNMINTGLNNNEEYAKIVFYNYLSKSDTLPSNNIINENTLHYIQNHPTKFSGAPFSFSMLEAVRYNEWLDSLANVKYKVNGGDQLAHKINILTRHDADPRELLAVLISDDSKNITNNLLSSDTGRRALKKANIFLNTYNHIENIKSISNEIDPRVMDGKY